MFQEQVVSIGIFVLVLGAIISEKVHRTVAALAGILLLLFSGILNLEECVSYIDFNTLGVLAGMMIFVGVIKESGLFEYLAIKAAKISRGNPWRLMVAFPIITAILSAFLDNVTTVLLVGPMTLTICSIMGLNPVPYLMTEIIASNIGGTATLIGDPPNIMIGSAAGLSFGEFVVNLAPVICVILVVTIICFRFIYGRKLAVKPEAMHKVMALNEAEVIKCKSLFRKSVTMIVLVAFAFIFHDKLGLETSTVALSAAVIMLLIGRQKVENVLADMEWATLLFFAGLFIVVGGMVKVGVITAIANHLIEATAGELVLTMIILLWGAAIISAILDNIPFVATIIPILLTMEASGIDVAPLWWAVSLGACLGGNGTLIGASANVVLSGISNQRGYPITFLGYLKVGFPLMILSIIIATGYLLLKFA